jgi:glycosyltransferase involved in cell wall biosynthesis
MKVTVIIPSFKRPSDLRRCLAAVAFQSRPADEVLVVGREGDTETSEIIFSVRLRLPTLRLVRVSEPGLIAALNFGLDSATGDLFALTDDDAEPQFDWLERIAASFADPSLGAVGGRDWIQLPSEPALFKPEPVSRIGVLTWYGAQYGNHHCPLRGHSRKVMFLKGVNMAFCRRALGSCRIDTRLRGTNTQMCTELDLCLQIRQAGFDVLFDDRILVKHYSSPRAAGDDRNQVTGSVFPNICFNNHYLIAKHFGLHRALAYFFYGRLFGSRSIPGLVACLKWRFKGDRQAWQRLGQMTRTGVAGFRSGRRARATAPLGRANVRANSSAIKIEGQAPERSSN